MKLILREFQEDAAARLVRHMRQAGRESKNDRQAVALSSTTGSGKTVMLTRAIEVLLEGDEDNPPIADATFLWITDQPELNEQTRKKMLATSSLLTTETLVVVDSTFDHETFQAGAVHFLNTQKLGKDKGLVSAGDKRTYSIWDTVRNTVDARPGRFFVIIDEAHRGMIEEKGQAEASTIIQKFIKGSNGELPPVPVVVGISATPDRFNTLLLGTGRMTRPVEVSVEDVRASGLIKETIKLHHPKKEQPTDMTMLREAARSLKDFTKQWSSYCAEEEDFEVVPLLVVQVEDAANRSRISETDIGQAITVLRDVLGTLPNDAFAHSFQEGMKLDIGGEGIRYLAPSDIEADPDVRVVFFKTSLNTGWDCPRAEVMMSFRSAADSTYIAQLVGRMVRTPLARRIAKHEVLNTVTLYLPHYDSKGLAKVVAKLSKPDDGMPPVDVEPGDDVIALHRRRGTEDLFDAIAALPSYIVPRKRKSSQVRRLMKFARLLTNDELDDAALTTAKEALLAVLKAEYSRVKGTKRFKEIVDDRGHIEIEAVNWDVGRDAVRTGDTVKVNIAAENIEDLFEATGRKLNEGLHKLWWRDRAKNPADRDKAKIELFALCVDPDVAKQVESAAQALVSAWLRKYRTAIAKLDESSRAAYAEIENLAASPELLPLSLPETTEGKVADQSWEKHIYVGEKNRYQAHFNKAESAVLERELSRKEVVGWLRNVDRKPWALCVPYELKGEDRAMYPDFLFVRKEDGAPVVDIVDPHAIGLADAPEKAAGFAKFAAKHANMFGRIEMILLDGTTEKRLDLTDETVRQKLLGAKVIDQLRALMSDE